MSYAQIVPRSRRFAGIPVAGALAAACIVVACGSKPAAPAAAPAASPNAWAVVDGKEITRDDVDRAYRRVRDESQPLSEEETLTAKLTLLNDMIVQEILLAKATALKLEVPQTDVDNAYNNAK